MARPSLLYLALGSMSWLPVKLLYRLRATGLEHVPREGGFVLAANHTSNFDPWPLALPLFPRRGLRFMAKSELYWWPLGPIISAGGAFPVRRGERDVEAIRTAVRLVREGHIVVMFPHGTRQRKGLIKRHKPRPHTGAARIALDADAPLVPAAIAGTDGLTRLRRWRIVFGAPVSLEGLPANRRLAAFDELSPQSVLNRVRLGEREIAIRLRERRHQPVFGPRIHQALDSAVNRNGHECLPLLRFRLIPRRCQARRGIRGPRRRRRRDAGSRRGAAPSRPRTACRTASGR